VLTGNWQALYDEMRDFPRSVRPRRISKPFSLPATSARSRNRQGINGLHDGRCRFHQDLHRKEGVNATLDVSLVMVRMIREYLERTGMMIGFKPAGVCPPPSRARIQILMKEELGREWLEPELFVSAHRAFSPISNGNSSITSPAATRLPSTSGCLNQHRIISYTSSP